METSERVAGIIAALKQEYPDALCALQYKKDYELMISVRLSAQCTDKRVNMTTPALFERFPDAKAMAAGTVEEIYHLIKSISYPNNKAKHLHEMAQKLERDFQGKVPEDMELLQTLPGVGRKTANVVMAVAFHKLAMPVDTHVFRVSNRLGLANAKDVLQTRLWKLRNSW